MKKFIAALLLILSLSFVITGCGKSEETENFELPENYKLAYSDEFNGELDETVWSKCYYGVRRGGYWSPEQVKTENGNLVVTTEYRDDVENPGYHTGGAWWNDNMRCTYGYYEMRADIENTRGVWSAFWLYPDTMGESDGSARDGAEIDVYESARPFRMQNAIHYDNFEKRKEYIRDKDYSLYNGYHTFALDWKKDSMKFYYDNKLVMEITDPELISQTAVGINLTTEINGTVDSNGTPQPKWGIWPGCGSITRKTNRLPSEFKVDYVRVYDNGDLVWAEQEEGK